MGNPIKWVGAEGEAWLRSQNSKAWEKMFKKYGDQIMRPVGPEQNVSPIEKERRRIAFENAVNHVHGAALIRSLTGSDYVTRRLGEVKEENQWEVSQSNPGEVRDIYGDLWNDETGNAIGASARTGNLRDIAMQAVLSGQAIVRKWGDPHGDPSDPGDARLKGVNGLSLEEMHKHAAENARRYWKKFGHADGEPHPQPLQRSYPGLM